MAPSAALEPAARGPKFHFEYYSPRPAYWSYDGLPFGSVYAVVLAAVSGLVLRKGTVLFEHLLWCLLPLTLHVALFLATQWSVKARCFVRFRRESHVDHATHVRVVPLPGASHKNYPSLLLLLVRQGPETSFYYQKKKFVYNKSTSQFERLRFNVSLSLEHYVRSVGLSAQELPDTARRYGANVYDIPLPTFGELFQEHAVAPFFVFQVFCVLLWLMDEYWYYSLLTLFMLIVLEAQMVHRRRSDLSELRAMRIPPRPVHVHRDGNWLAVQSDHLLPGDVVALARKADASFPCDVLLLQGNVLVNEAMLTGESVPQMKVAVSLAPDSVELQAKLDIKGLHKQHIVSAGTYIMLHQNTSKAKNIKKPPVIGSSATAVGYVLRTGFDTTQGKLCRTILFSAERVTVQSRDALHFLMILLAFAIGACAYVLYDGLVVAPTRIDEPARSTFKLFLAVSHIITSVVPPEFPIMLSLAVNLSLVALVRKRIFCTEPFRVPLAGRVETCCFDKTGTLTSDAMEVGGVHGLASAPPPPLSDSAVGEGEQEGREAYSALEQPLPFLTTAVMAACSGLTIVDGEVVGDPLERAALHAVRWLMISPDLVASRAGRGADRLQVLCRFPFASELQRMAVLVRHQGPGCGHMQGAPFMGGGAGATRGEFDRWLALVKGSCEALRPRLRDVPPDFDTLQDKLAKSGFRVLCLAAKEVPAEIVKVKDPAQMPREELEMDLEFGGLLVLRNSIKAQVSSTVKQLRRSYHRVIMITGDHPLTACQVATHVAMAEGRFLMLEKRDIQASQQSDGAPSIVSSSTLEWRSRDDPTKSAKPFSLDRIRELTRKHTLCVPGWSLACLTEDELRLLAPFVTVFARVSPQQKEQVVTALNKQSHTVMVGDGTNDVGALKHAHVGISLMTATPSSALPAASSRPHQASSPEAMNDQAPLVRLGDASIASPFTYKGDSIKCTLHILRCGRATLATVLMMYKIMGLNSVMSAFAMSVLTLDGVKLGDGQTAVESLFTSMCFFLVSRSSPAKDLAKQQPTGNVFAWHVLLSLALQLAVHLTVLYNGWILAKDFRSKEFKRDVEGDFEPNLTNTVVFQLMAAMHASSFLANYEGHPFMQPMSANRALFYSLSFFVVVIFATGAEVIPDMNAALSMVPYPTAEFRRQILTLLVLDLGLSVGLSQGVGALAIQLRGHAAERRAREWGLGLPSDGEREGRAHKKAK